MNNKLNDVKLFINQMNSVNPNINYNKLEEIKENEKYNPNNNDNANNR